MKENTLGDISGKKAPCSGQANSSEYGITWPFSVFSACSFLLSLLFGLSKLSIAMVPPPKCKPDSIASVNLCLFARLIFNLSILTSTSCLRFFSNSGGFSKLAIRPLILPSKYPCSTSPLNKSTCVPFRLRIVGLQIAIACSSKRHIASSTISCTVLLATSRPQSGQCGIPTLAQSNLI